jgi:hypothetical protein
MLTATDIARICHAANAELCSINEDWSQQPWGEAPKWARDSAIDGVALHLTHPETTPEESHSAWMRAKLATGWSYGPEKNPDLKTHPCMVPYDQLPPEQRAKDHLFKAVVQALAPFVGVVIGVVILALTLSASALAHTPTITPAKGKPGDLPPILEDKPLPPFVVSFPSPAVPGAVVVLWVP